MLLRGLLHWRLFSTWLAPCGMIWNKSLLGQSKLWRRRQDVLRNLFTIMFWFLFTTQVRIHIFNNIPWLAKTDESALVMGHSDVEKLSKSLDEKVMKSIPKNICFSLLTLFVLGVVYLNMGIFQMHVKLLWQIWPVHPFIDKMSRVGKYWTPDTRLKFSHSSTDSDLSVYIIKKERKKKRKKRRRLLGQVRM